MEPAQEQSNIVKPLNTIDELDEDFTSTSTSTSTSKPQINESVKPNPFEVFKQECETYKLTDKQKQSVQDKLKSKSNKEIIEVISSILIPIVDKDMIKFESQLKSKSKRELIEMTLTYVNQMNMSLVLDNNLQLNNQQVQTTDDVRNELRKKLHSTINKNKHQYQHTGNTHSAPNFQDKLFSQLLGNDPEELKHISKMSMKKKKKYLMQKLTQQLMNSQANVETPSVETPSVETPSVETPSVETPSVETPSVETPSV
jgi:hypothetical protein